MPHGELAEPGVRKATLTRALSSASSHGPPRKALACAALFVTMPVWASMCLLGAARLTSYKLPEREPVGSESSSKEKRERRHEAAATTEPCPVCPVCPPAPRNEGSAEKELRAQLVQEQDRTRRASQAAAQEAEERKRLSRELEDVKAKLAAVAPSLKRARERTDEMEKRAQDAESAASAHMGAFAWTLQNFIGPHIAALLAGLFGLAAVAGPMTYLKMYKLLLGSAVGGVILAGSLGYFAAPVADGWVERSSAILDGDGNFGEYLVVSLMMLFGVLRYWRGWDWVLYAYVDEAYLAPPVADSGLREPLLGHGGSLSKAQQDNFAVLMGMQDNEPEAASIVDNLIQLTRRESHMEAAKEHPDWFKDFWADVSMELVRGDCSKELLTLLMQHGYNPEQPREAQAPSLLCLSQALEDFKISEAHHQAAGQGSYFGSGFSGGPSFEPPRPAVDEV